MPEKALSVIMKTGLNIALLFISAGLILMFSGRYTKDISLTHGLIQLLTDGAGLMYVGTLVIVSVPIIVLIYLGVYFLLQNKKRYTLYSLLIIGILAAVVFSRI